MYADNPHNLLPHLKEATETILQISIERLETNLIRIDDRAI